MRRSRGRRGTCKNASHFESCCVLELYQDALRRKSLCVRVLSAWHPNQIACLTRRLIVSVQSVTHRQLSHFSLANTRAFVPPLPGSEPRPGPTLSSPEVSDRAVLISLTAPPPVDIRPGRRPVAAQSRARRAGSCSSPAGLL